MALVGIRETRMCVRIGAELGSSLTDNEVQSSDQSSQVAVPKYGIYRLRPRASGTLEFWNFTLSVSASPRYLFSQENVTREYDSLLANGHAAKTIRFLARIKTDLERLPDYVCTLPVERFGN